MIKLSHILKEIKVVRPPKVWDLDNLGIDNEETARYIYDQFKVGDILQFVDGDFIEWEILGRSENTGNETYPDTLTLAELRAKEKVEFHMNFEDFLENRKLL